MGFSAETRRTILDRDRRCIPGVFLGGDCAGPLHCHHIIPERLNPALSDDPGNGVTVCQAHHPSVELVARALRLYLDAELPACHHRHPYREGRLQCERERRDRLFARRLTAA